MDMITVNNKAEAQALIDAAVEKGFKAKKVKLSDCYLVMVFA